MEFKIGELFIGMSPLAYPAGNLLQGFAAHPGFYSRDLGVNDNGHIGLDFFKFGQPDILPGYKCTVVFVNDNLDTVGGKAVLCESEDINGFKYQTIYGHLEKIYVKVGDVLEATTPLGKMGHTGLPGSTGNLDEWGGINPDHQIHLHFGLQVYKKVGSEYKLQNADNGHFGWVDPLPYLSILAAAPKPTESPVSPALSFKVLEVGDQGTKGYGRFVRLLRPDGSVTIYGHLKQVLVRVGDVVSATKQIAISNNSGNSTGSHLHFGYRPARPNLSNGYSGYEDQLGLIKEHPVKPARITQKFGQNPAMYKSLGLKGHNGIDYGVPTGTAVYPGILTTDSKEQTMKMEEANAVQAGLYHVFAGRELSPEEIAKVAPARNREIIHALVEVGGAKGQEMFEKILRDFVPEIKIAIKEGRI